MCQFIVAKFCLINLLQRYVVFGIYGAEKTENLKIFFLAKVGLLRSSGCEFVHLYFLDAVEYLILEDGYWGKCPFFQKPLQFDMFFS